MWRWTVSVADHLPGGKVRKARRELQERATASIDKAFAAIERHETMTMALNINDPEIAAALAAHGHKEGA